MKGRRHSRVPGLLLLALVASWTLAPLALAQEPPEGAEPPRAEFTIPGRVDPGQNVTASAHLQARAVPPCTPLALYEWDFDGDGLFERNGTHPSGAIVSHRFEAPGTFPVTLRVTDSCGQTAETTKEVVVAPDDAGGLDFGVVFDNQGSFLRATRLVLWLSVASIVAGLPLGILIGLARMSGFAPLRWVAGAYIEFLRGTPFLVQLFIVWLALPQLIPALKFDSVTAGLIALTINTSAYQAEIVRSGIQAIPSGQREAALGMGLSRFQTMRFVILPQALRLVIPPLTNEFIILIKDTSLLSVIGVIELMYVARVLGFRTLQIAEPLIAVAVIYFIITYSLSLLLQYLERRLAIPGLGIEGQKGAH